MKLLPGIFNQPKFIPLRYCPISLELELVGSATDCILHSDCAIKKGPSDTTDVLLQAGSTSAKWHIENVQIKCDLITLDNAVQNQYAQHLLDGKSLPIACDTFINHCP